MIFNIVQTVLHIMKIKFIRGVPDISINIKYDKQSSKRILSGKEFIVTNLIPHLKIEEKKQVSEEVKNSLFQVFKKYV